MRKVRIIENVRHIISVSFYDGENIIHVEVYKKSIDFAMDAIINWCESGILPK